MLLPEASISNEKLVKNNSIRLILKDHAHWCWMGAFVLKFIGFLGGTYSLFSLGATNEWARFGIMLGSTMGMLLYFLLRKYEYIRLHSLTILHWWLVSSVSFELIFLGSHPGRNLWVYLFFSHSVLSIILVQSYRKAFFMGVYSLSSYLIAATVHAGDPALGGTISWHMTLILTPSVAEALLVSLFFRLEQKDRKLVELAVQYETGMRMLSHDLANILEVSKDNVELTLEEIEENNGNINQQGLTYLDETRWSLHQCVAMLGSVRDYVAFMNGKKDPLRDDFLLGDAVKMAIQIWQRQAKRKNISLVLVNNLPPAETRIRGSNPLFVYTILGNLISNAIKFSPVNEKIVIEISRDTSLQNIFLDFLDSGEGFDQVKANQMFEPQGMTNSLGASGEKGTGFGMPLVKQTLGLFMGQIIPFANHQGSTKGQPAPRFRIHLPSVVTPVSQVSVVNPGAGKKKAS
jgi:signal transduction histidine kinase